MLFPSNCTYVALKLLISVMSIVSQLPEEQELVKAFKAIRFPYFLFLLESWQKRFLISLPPSPPLLKH